MRKIRCIVVTTALSSLLVTGCGSYDYSKIPYEPYLTRQEAVDYYSNQMSYDSIVKRSAVKNNKIEWNKVPDNIADKLWAETSKVITTHQLNQGYEGEMSRYVHDYLKLTLDSLVLEEPDGGFTYTEAENRGYYFVTVDFKTKLNRTGSLKGEANYIGVNGAIIDKTVDGTNEVPVLNTGYMASALAKMNEYREKNRLEPYPEYGTAFTNNNVDELIDKSMDSSDAEGNKVIAEASTEAPAEESTEQALDENGNPVETQDTENSDLDTSNNSNNSYEYSDNNEEAINNSYANNIRQLLYNVKDFNNIVGSSNEQMAAVPYIDMVYEPVEPVGSLSGYGVFAEGAYGLRDFGYKRADYGTGSIKITFVFKQNAQKRDKFDYSYCYINEYKTNISLPDKNIVQSSYIDGMLDVAIERADRAIIDKDAPALMGKDIFEPSDLGLKELELRNASNVLSFMTKRVKTLDRKDKEYLVELERTSESSPRGLGNTAKYKDKYYAVIRQDGVDFKINDIVWVSRTLERIPEPDGDDSITRRLTSLNLAGEVTDQSKSEITEMMNKLTAGINNRVADDKTTDDGSPVYGIYSRFDDDKALLSTEKGEYLKSKLLTRMNKFGSNKKVNVALKFTEWLGGYNDQVEFETEELYTYDGIDKGVYVKNYYLVSHYGKDWVIDDIVPIEEKDVTGEELAQYKSLLGAN
jgi:lipoprotein